MASSAFEFSEEQLSMIVDALTYQLTHDDEMCDACIDEAAMLTDLLLQHMVGRHNRANDEARIIDLFKAKGLEE